MHQSNNKHSHIKGTIEYDNNYETNGHPLPKKSALFEKSLNLLISGYIGQLLLNQELSMDIYQIMMFQYYYIAQPIIFVHYIVDGVTKQALFI